MRARALVSALYVGEIDDQRRVRYPPGLSALLALLPVDHRTAGGTGISGGEFLRPDATDFGRVAER
jgi:hypothetical protein